MNEEREEGTLVVQGTPVVSASRFFPCIRAVPKVLYAPSFVKSGTVTSQPIIRNLGALAFPSGKLVQGCSFGITFIYFKICPRSVTGCHHTVKSIYSIICGVRIMTFSVNMSQIHTYPCTCRFLCMQPCRALCCLNTTHAVTIGQSAIYCFLSYYFGYFPYRIWLGHV